VGGPVRQGPDGLARFSLAGRVAIVTGTSSGLGITLAGALAEAGADVVLAARRADRMKEARSLVEAAGRRALVVPTDISVEPECRRLVDATVEEFGRLDILVNNAGIGAVGPAHRQSAADFQAILNVNLSGTHWLSVAAAGAMSEGGSIINISSVLAMVTAGMPQAAYAASKAGILGLTRDLAQEWTGRKGIRVNAIAPGFFATEMTDGYDEHLERRVEQRIPAGRLGRPDDLSGAVIYLAGDASQYVTGQTLVVDGGFLIT
jgi:NAD(P)-dependent dehydrogenase (short-subunit alcohol dehydrogenase family)